MSTRGNSRPDPFSRFSDPGPVVVTPAAYSDRVSSPWAGWRLDVDVEEPIPEFLRESLDGFISSGSDRNARSQLQRSACSHDPQMAKALLLGQVLKSERAQEEDDVAAQHARERFGLGATMVAAKSIGLRVEMEKCASMVLQACVRSHLAQHKLRINRKVAGWGQKCYRRLQARRQARAQREEMEQYARRLAQSQHTMPSEERGLAESTPAEALMLKQRQWGTVNDRFRKFKEQQDKDQSLARAEQRARHREQKLAEVKAVEIRVAEENSAFLTEAKRTVWVGHIPIKFATQHTMLALMERIGKVVSIRVRVKQDEDDAGASWALVMFERKEAAERSFNADLRTECGLGVTSAWQFCAIQPEKIESLKAKLALADMQLTGLAKDLEIRRQKIEAQSISKAKEREHARVLRERRTIEISAAWETINRQHLQIAARDSRQRETKKIKEEQKLHHHLLAIFLRVWSSYANIRTRLNARNKQPEIKEAAAEMDRLMKAGSIPLASGWNENAGDDDMMKCSPTLYVAAMNAFYRQQRTLIRSFVSWKIYMDALRNDPVFIEQTHKALYAFQFHKICARNFGIQMKLDRMDGLRDAPSVHEWFAPRERHEQNLAEQSESTTTVCTDTSSDSDTESDCKGCAVGSSGCDEQDFQNPIGGDANKSTSPKNDENSVVGTDGQPDGWTSAERDLVASMFPGAL